MATKADVVGGIIISGITSLMIGWSFGMANSGSSYDRTRIFERDGKPSVMREYQQSSKDRILVQDSTGQYTPLVNYLQTIPDEYDRDIERTEIERVVGWKE